MFSFNPTTSNLSSDQKVLKDTSTSTRQTMILKTLFTVKAFNSMGLKFHDFYQLVFHNGLNFTDKPLLMYDLHPQIL